MAYWWGAGSATNGPPPSFSPHTGLFYVGTTEGFAMSYLVDTSEKPEGYGFTGGGPQGLLSTAGGMLFGKTARKISTHSTLRRLDSVAYVDANTNQQWRADLSGGWFPDGCGGRQRYDLYVYAEPLGA